LKFQLPSFDPQEMGVRERWFSRAKPTDLPQNLHQADETSTVIVFTHIRGKRKENITPPATE
jgi:hypothetical protein